MKILVTGAYGQLGSELKEVAAQFPDYKILFTDVDILDITNESGLKTFFLENKPDYVVNCAAYTAVDKAETEPDIAGAINSTAPKLLGKFSKEVGAKLIHISTDYVFDGNANRPLLETDTVNPKGVYGQTKLEGEKNCLDENENTVIIRTSWLYSSFGNNFVKTMLRLGNERDELKVVFDQIGTPTYAGDLAEAIFSIIRISENESINFVPGVYHYSNEGVASWFDFSKAIFEIEKIVCNVQPVLSDQFPTPAKRPNYSVLNKSKIKDIFGIRIPYWRDSLEVCLKKIENQ